MIQTMSRVKFLALVFMVYCIPSSAQLASNTSLVGNIADSSGAALSGGQVVALNQGTGETVSTNSNEVGNYEFQFLKPGSYTITVKSQGFSTSSTKDILLSANQTVRTDFALQVGAVDTRVEVPSLPT